MRIVAEIIAICALSLQRFMEEIRKIQIADFDYNLPEQHIARYPLDRREQSKLLLHSNGKIGQDHFFNIGNYLPANALIVSNETRVIRARLQFKKESGTTIELFCLEPEVAIADFQLAFGSSSPVVWKCLVGNSKRWKSGVLKTDIELEGTKVRFSAFRLSQHSDHSMVQFSWDAPSFSFGQILEAAGEIPLPPYLNRKAEVLDQTRYQTVFARFEGSVAAPTAGLHFTQDVINELIDKGMRFEKVTLHVGAGTFKPVSTTQIGDHEMHSERIIVNRE
ncbi:MAG: S-adenosylmethionine:tRNA ribosyltransferase-isomerase, partial [Ignavibacteria bacterium]|nr:S-adenosylmethionine:tRNA ribosyltransferase-isomerase [Ignavibacteria bacterium]